MVGRAVEASRTARVAGIFIVLLSRRRYHASYTGPLARSTPLDAVPQHNTALCHSERSNVRVRAAYSVDAQPTF